MEPPILQLILASASPYRLQQLQQQFHISPRQLASHIDESALENEPPEDMAIRLSEAKARAISSQLNGPAVIIAGDQTAQWNHTLLRKPLNQETAITQLKQFSGKVVTFHSGLCVFNSQNNQILCESVTTEVRFRQLTSLQIEAYVRRDKPFDCVGAFKNESLGIALFESIVSTDPSALTGLPLIKLNHFLLELGIDVLRMR